jgi:hypothetical protein
MLFLYAFFISASKGYCVTEIYHLNLKYFLAAAVGSIGRAIVKM